MSQSESSNEATQSASSTSTAPSDPARADQTTQETQKEQETSPEEVKYVEVGRLFYFPEGKIWHIEIPQTDDYVTTTEVVCAEDFLDIAVKIHERAHRCPSTSP